MPETQSGHSEILYFCLKTEFKAKQARKGFRPPSAMHGIGYFQNLRNFLEFRTFGGIFWGFSWRIFLEELFWRIFLEDFIGRYFLGEIFWEIFLGGLFWEDFLGEIFCEEFFVKNSLFTLLKSSRLFEYGGN